MQTNPQVNHHQTIRTAGTQDAPLFCAALEKRLEKRLENELRTVWTALFFISAMVGLLVGFVFL